MEEVEGYLWWSKIDTEEKFITDWEYQSNMKDKGPRQTVGCLN